MREKFAVAKQGQRELAAYIKDNPQLTWFEIALNRNVSLSQVSKVAKMHNLSRPVAVRNLLSLAKTGATDQQSKN